MCVSEIKLFFFEKVSEIKLDCLHVIIILFIDLNYLNKYARLKVNNGQILFKLVIYLFTYIYKMNSIAQNIEKIVNFTQLSII